VRRIISIAMWLALTVPAWASGTARYVAANGNDSNNGTSESTPWAHVPGMGTFTGSYTSSPGDTFTLRGCDVWTNANFPIVWTWSGSSGSPITFTRDTTWYNTTNCPTGWNRAVFNAGGTVMGGTECPSGSTNFYTNFFWKFSASYINVMWAPEMTGLYWAGTCNNGGFVTVQSGGNIIFDHPYGHHWSANHSTAADIQGFVSYLGGSGACGSTSTTNCTWQYGVFDNSDGDGVSGGGTQSFNSMYSIYKAMTNAIKPYSNGEIGGNLITGITNSFDGVTHENCIETIQAQGTGIYYIHDNVITGNVECEGLQVGNSGETDYVWNNIWNSSGAGNNGPQVPQSSPSGSMYFWNNTVAGGWPYCIQNAGHGSAFTGTFWAANNHCINSSSAITDGSFTAGTLTIANNVGMTPALAATQGFANTQYFQFSPTSLTNSTFGAGANLTSSWPTGTSPSGGTFSTNDSTYAAQEEIINGVVQAVAPTRTSQVRPLTGAWAAGYANGLSPCTAPNYPCITVSQAVIQNISPTPNVGNLTGAGTVVTPTDFNTPICRLSDANFDPALPNRTIAADASGSGDETLFNANSTLAIIAGSGGQGYPISFSFNGVTCTVTRLYASNPSWTAHGGWYLTSDAVGWSYANPNLFFIVDPTNPAIDSYNVAGYTPTGTPPSNVATIDFRAGQTGGWGTTSSNCLPSTYAMTWSSFGQQNKAIPSVLAADQIFGMGVSDAIVIAGSVASGTFTTGETVTQSGTGATAKFHFIQTNMYVDTVTGSPNNSGTWTGGSSGATFTPTAVPANAGQDYGTDAVAYKVGSGCAYLNTLTGVVTSDFGTVGTIANPDRFTVHNAKLSKDGSTLLLTPEYCLSTSCVNQTNTPYQWVIGSTTLNNGCVAPNNCGGHFTEGYANFVNDDGSPTAQQIIRPYGNNSTPTTIPMGLPWAGSTCTGANVLEIHQNWANVAPGDLYPFFLTTGAVTPTTVNRPYICAGMDEIQAVSPTAGTVWRFAHTYNSDENVLFQTANAIGAVSQDGNYALWGSDWEGTLGSTSGGSTCTLTTNCRGDVFLAQLAIPATPQAATPTFSVSSGTYHVTLFVTISSSSSGALVCYNTAGGIIINGSATCPAGSTQVTGQVIVNGSETLYAVAGGPGYSDSTTATAPYTLTPTPGVYVLSPPHTGGPALSAMYAVASGFAVIIPWTADSPASPVLGGWETSNGGCTASAGYNFTNFDAVINAQLGFGAQSIVIHLAPTSSGGHLAGKNTDTPCYVFSSNWSTFISSPTGQLYTCADTDYPGAGTIPPGTCKQGVDNMAYPVAFQAPFMTAWGNAVAAAIAHIKASSYASKIAYISVGGGTNGEWLPYAVTGLETQVSPSTIAQLQNVWINTYMSNIQSKIVAANGQFSVNQTMNGGLLSVPYTFADTAATLAIGNGFGLADQGLQNYDITAFANFGTASGGSLTNNTYPTGDHAYNYNKYPAPPIHEFQTGTTSNPANFGPYTVGVMGSLVALIPYGISRGGNRFELYYNADWQTAYDSTVSTYANYHLAYQQIIQAILQGGNALTVTSGSGGTVTDNYQEITCATINCVGYYPVTTTVTLTPHPNAGQVFAGWTGACSGLGACSVLLSSAASVGASFAPVGTAVQPTLTPGTGIYAGTRTVIISSTSPGVIICWNTTGSPQTNGLGTGCTSGTLLANGGTISVATSETVYAVAGSASLTDSSIGSAIYTIIPATSGAFSITIGVQITPNILLQP
jgi:hypothetical protein